MGDRERRGHTRHRRAARQTTQTHFTVTKRSRDRPDQAAPCVHDAMTHDLGHAATTARLPAGVELAYDGLVLDVSVDVE